MQTIEVTTIKPKAFSSAKAAIQNAKAQSESEKNRLLNQVCGSEIIQAYWTDTSFEAILSNKKSLKIRLGLNLQVECDIEDVPVTLPAPKCGIL